ncbi:MAG: hypothetical protein ABL908_08185 [Hyphomicrobium sp.]
MQNDMLARSEPPSDDEPVRRVDANLRSTYPFLKTRLFALGPHQYVIVFDRQDLPAQAIADEFANEIRFITLQVGVSNDVPSRCLRELEPIADHAIAASYHGLPFNETDLTHILKGKFPALPINGLGTSSEPGFVRILVAEPLATEQQDALFAFCLGLGMGVELARGEPVDRPDHLPPDLPLVQHLKRHRRAAAAFIRDDERFWFDRVEPIFEGRVRPENYPRIEGGGAKCTIDASLNVSQLQIREALAFFDTICLTPPVAPQHQEFLDAQRISEDELLFLAEQGRLKLICTMREETFHLPFLEAASERAPDCIVGHYRTAGLIAARAVETADEYLLTRPEWWPALRETAKVLADECGVNALAVARQLLWPASARRQLLWMLYQMGPSGAAGTGLTRLLADRFGRDKSDDERAQVEFNLDLLSNPVLLSHALRATHVPRLGADAAHVGLQRHIGELLNMYSNVNGRIAASWAGDMEGTRHIVRLVAPIPIFEFPRAVSIREIHEVTSFGATTRFGRGLLTRLDVLPAAARQDELDRLAEALRKAKAHGSESRFLSLKYAMAAAGFGLAFNQHPLAGIIALLLPWSNVHQMAEPLITKLRRTRAVDQFMVELEADFKRSAQSNQEITFLERLDGVATLQSTKVS